MNNTLEILNSIIISYTREQRRAYQKRKEIESIIISLIGEELFEKYINDQIIDAGLPGVDTAPKVANDIIAMLKQVAENE